MKRKFPIVYLVLLLLVLTSVSGYALVIVSSNFPDVGFGVNISGIVETDTPITSLIASITDPDGATVNVTGIQLNNATHWGILNYTTFVNGTHNVSLEAFDGIETANGVDSFDARALLDTNIDVEKDVYYNYFINSSLTGGKIYITGEEVDLRAPESNLSNVSYRLVVNYSPEINSEIDVELVWIIDSTGSMQPHVGQVKESIDGFLANLNASGIAVRHGLITYKDRLTEQNEFTQTTNDTLFSSYVNSISFRGGRDTPENPYLAMHTAIGNGTNYDFKESAYKYMIFITDQTAHTPDSPGDAGGDALYYQNETIDLLNAKGFKLMTSTFASRFDLYAPMSSATDGEIYELGEIDFFLDDITDVILNDTSDARYRTQPFMADVQFVNFTGNLNKTVRELVEEDIAINPDTVFPADLYTNATYTIHSYDVVIVKANAPDGTDVADLITYKFAVNESGDPINGTNVSAVENSSLFFFYPNLIYYSYVYNKGDVDVGFCLNIIIEYYNETSMDYEFHETIYEANNTYGAVVGEYISYNELWREKGFNTINSPAGTYRAVAEVRDHDGNLFVDSEGTELRSFSEFIINETDVSCDRIVIDGDAEFSEPLICEEIIVENEATVGFIANGSFIASVVTLRENSTINGSRINITAEILEIEYGSVITTLGKGFGTSQGPGHDTSINGRRASHGGRCAQSTCEVYGSVYQPTTLGSGGTGGAGGGAVKIIATTLDNNGTITSNGAGYFLPTPSCGVLSGGAGGSILIDTEILRGNGTIEASGGLTRCGASQYGGGGRVAIYYNQTTWDLTNFSQVNVHDGYITSVSTRADPGTVIAIDKDDNEVFITGASQFNHSYTNGSQLFNEIRLDTGTAGYNFTKIVLKDIYYATYDFNDTLYAEELYVINTSLSGEANFIVEGTNNALFDSSSLQLGAYVHNESLATVTLQNDTTLNAGWINMTINQLVVDNTSVLTSQDKGFEPFIGSGYTGPGYFSASDGGSYGGRCANNGCIRYGSAYQPLQLGSGGGGSHGGGAVILFVNNITLNGVISSDGGDFFDNTPSCSVISLSGGSGGSVFLVVNSLEGTGTLEANGGLSKCGIRRYGAGGRIALYYNSSSWENSNFSQIEVSETYISTDGNSADPGTVIAINMIENTAFISGSFDFNETYFDGLEQQNETRYDTGTTGYNFTRMVLQNGKDMSYYSSSLFRADELLIINSTLEDSDNMSIEAYTLTMKDSNLDLEVLQTNNSFGTLLISNTTLITDGKIIFNYTLITLQDSIIDFYNLTINLSDRGSININGTTLNADTLRFGKVSLYNDNITIYNSTIDVANFTMAGEQLYIDEHSLITTQGKGYPVEQGPGFFIAPPFSTRRASHGGSCFGADCQEYGNPFQPIQHGSGGGRNFHPEFSGGGVIRIDTERLILDGNLSADGGDGGSASFGDGSGAGGSIFITTTYLEGESQDITANGGFINDIRTAGGGGRIAIYYNESTWNESTFYRIETGQYSKQKVISNAPHAGSVVTVNRSDNTVRITDGFTFQSTYLNGTNEFLVTRWDNQSIDTFPSLVIRNATNLVMLNDTILTTPYLEINNATWYGRTSHLTLNASTLVLSNVTFNFTTLLSLRIDNLTVNDVVFDEDLILELFNEQFGSVRWANGVASPFASTLEEVSIQQGKISVDSSLLPELDDDALLVFKNITFDNPVVVQTEDGTLRFTLCTVCSNNVYDEVANQFSVDVSGFSTYQIIEGENGEVNVSVTFDDSLDPVERNDLFNYTVNVSNAGNISLYNYNVTLNLDSSLTLMNTSVAFNESTTWFIDVLHPNESFNAMITVNATANTTQVNSSLIVSFQAPNASIYGVNISEQTNITLGFPSVGDLTINDTVYEGAMRFMFVEVNDSDLVDVNFILVQENGSIVLNESMLNNGTHWVSSAFTIIGNQSYFANATAVDLKGNTNVSTKNLEYLIVIPTFGSIENQTQAEYIQLEGIVNSTNNTNVSGTNVSIYLNGTYVNGTVIIGETYAINITLPENNGNYTYEIRAYLHNLYGQGSVVVQVSQNASVLIENVTIVPNTFEQGLITVVSATIDTHLTIDAVAANVLHPDGNQTSYLLSGGPDVYTANITNTSLVGQYNVTIEVNTTNGLQTFSNQSNFTVIASNGGVTVEILQPLDNTTLDVTEGEVNITTMITTTTSPVTNCSLALIVNESGILANQITLGNLSANVSLNQTQIANITEVGTFELIIQLRCNEVVVNSTPITVRSDDIQVPQITIITPQEDDIVGFAVLLSSFIEDFNVTFVNYTIVNTSNIAQEFVQGNLTLNGGRYEDIWNTNISYPYNVSQLPSINVTLYIQAYDGNNNTARVNSSWILDNTQPNIQFVYPMQNGSFTSTDQQVLIWVSNTRLDTIQFAIYNASQTIIATNITTNGSQYLLNETLVISSLNEGNYTVRVIANDSISNQNNKTSWVYIDKTAPIISGNGWVEPTPENNSIVNVTLLELAFVCNDTFIDQGWVEINGTNVSAVIINQTFYVNYTIGEGVFTYQGFCRDQALNTITTELRQIIIDQTEPVIVNSVPINLTTTGNEVTIGCNVTDNRNISTVTFNVSLINGTSVFVNTSYINNSSAFVNYTLTLTGQQEYIWSCFVNDTAGNNAEVSGLRFSTSLGAPWRVIEVSEGVYEPFNASVAGTRLDTFFIRFANITTETGSNVSCIVKQSDGSLMTLSSDEQISNEYLYLNYTLTPTDAIINDPLVGYVPWVVKNCTYAVNGTPQVDINVTQRIYVHEGIFWTDDEVTRAVACEGTPQVYFNNSARCNFVQDTLFALQMRNGNPVEESCFSDPGTECTNTYCQGILFPSCIGPDFFLGYSAAVDDPNGYAVFNVSFGNYLTEIAYTYYVNSSGSFKLRVLEELVDQPFSITIFNLSSVDTATVTGGNTGGGIVSVTDNGDGTFNVALNRLGSGFTGTLDAVFNVTFSNTSIEDNRSLRLVIAYGVETNQGSPALFPVEFSPVYGLQNQEEFAQSPITIDAGGTCGDEVNNDFDYGTLGFALTYDCLDTNCDGEQGDDNQLNEFGNGKTGLCTFGIETICDDEFDNDYDTILGTDFTDCHDADCFQNNPSCPRIETICNDGINNDWDYTLGESDESVDQKIDNNGSKYTTGQTAALIDCEDSDCDGNIGGSSGELCSYGTELFCFDGFDNDALQLKDCELASLNNSITLASQVTGEYDCALQCRVASNLTEFGTLCEDNLDNDYDAIIPTGRYSDQFIQNTSGGVDCRWGGYFGYGTDYNPDEGCNGTLMSSGAFCELGREVSCSDAYDNDKDYDATGMPRAGWNQNPAGYVAIYGTSYVEDADFDDYDCQADSGVISNESINVSFCFDGVDNDLDAYEFSGTWVVNSSGGIDCGDPDCLGAVNPDDPTQRCLAREFDASDPFFTSLPYPGIFCENTLDDDADGDIDCADGDCLKQFDTCSYGPCYATENILWDSCFDNEDNDFGDGVDCADSDCVGMFGSATGAVCEVFESQCADGVNNDAQGGTDCADTLDCADNIGGYVNGTAVYCRATESTLADCTDGFDNDADGAFDCMDTSCYAACGYTAVVGVGVEVIPEIVDQNLGGVNALLKDVSATVKVGDIVNITLEESGVSTSVQWTLGTASGDQLDKTFLTNARISGPDVADFSIIETVNGYIIESSVAHPSGYSILVSFDTVSVGSDTFEVTFAETSGSQTSLNNFVNVTVVENNAPSAGSIFVNPETFSLFSGEELYVLGEATDDSAVGTCLFTVSGVVVSNFNEQDCQFSMPIADEGALQILFEAQDRYGTTSNQVVENYDINIIPEFGTITVNTVFPTENTSLVVNAPVAFVAQDSLTTCELYFNDTYIASGTVSGGVCEVSVANLQGRAEGKYTVSLRATEITEQDMIRSEGIGILLCNQNSSGSCQFIDRDANNLADYCPVLTAIEENLVVELEVDKGEGEPGELLTYTIRVENRGTTNASNVNITLLLPENVELDGADNLTEIITIGAGGVFEKVVVVRIIDVVSDQEQLNAEVRMVFLDEMLNEITETDTAITVVQVLEEQEVSRTSESRAQGSGSGRASCVVEWTCSAWGACEMGTQSRVCQLRHDCDEEMGIIFLDSKPEEIQVCTNKKQKGEPGEITIVCFAQEEYGCHMWLGKILDPLHIYAMVLLEMLGRLVGVLMVILMGIIGYQKYRMSKEYTF